MTKNINSEMAAAVRAALAKKIGGDYRTQKEQRTEATTQPGADLQALLHQLAAQLAQQQQSAPKTAAKKDDKTVVVSYDEYKGNEMMTIQRGNGRPFSFGRSKAQMIVESIDAIRSFAQGE